MILDCRGYHPRDYFTTSELVKRYFHTLTARQSFASGAARALGPCVLYRPSEQLSHPRRMPEPTATARIGRAPRRGWRQHDQSTCCPATHCSTCDLGPHCLGPRASRPLRQVPAHPARTRAACRRARRAGWAGRICGTAPPWRGRGRQASGVSLRWRSGWQTPRAPHRLAHVAQPICITREAVPDGSAWFRVVLIFRPSRAPTTRRWRW